MLLWKQLVVLIVYLAYIHLIKIHLQNLRTLGSVMHDAPKCGLVTGPAVLVATAMNTWSGYWTSSTGGYGHEHMVWLLDQQYWWLRP